MTTFRVTRYCCRSAHCVDCHGRGSTGDLSKRARVVQADKLGKTAAHLVVQGWREFGAQMELDDGSPFPLEVSDTPPPEIVRAAETVSAYFAERGISGWSLAGCSDRNSGRRDA